MNNPHKNARACFYSREQIVPRHQNGETAADIAAAFAIMERVDPACELTNPCAAIEAEFMNFHDKADWHVCDASDLRRCCNYSSSLLKITPPFMMRSSASS